MRITTLKHIGLPLALWCVFSIPVYADTAFFDGNVMHVPELLVFQEDVPQLLQQVELQKGKGNNFVLVNAGGFDQASVQSISADAEVVRGDALVVHIEGEKSLECVTLNPVSVSRVDNAFHLVVTEQPVPAHVSCMVGTHPFQLDSMIDTTLLESGTYSIYVHGLYIEVIVKEQD